MIYLNHFSKGNKVKEIIIITDIKKNSKRRKSTSKFNIYGYTTSIFEQIRRGKKYGNV